MQQYYNMGCFLWNVMQPLWDENDGIGFSLPYERLLILCILTWFVASYYLSGECTNECQLLLPSPHPSWSLQCMIVGAIFQQNFHISCSIQISFQINSAILQKLSPAYQRIKCRSYEHLNAFVWCLRWPHDFSLGGWGFLPSPPVTTG